MTYANDIIDFEALGWPVYESSDGERGCLVPPEAVREELTRRGLDPDGADAPQYRTMGEFLLAQGRRAR